MKISGFWVRNQKTRGFQAEVNLEDIAVFGIQVALAAYVTTAAVHLTQGVASALHGIGQIDTFIEIVTEAASV
jgi:hypothetical protein